MAKEEGYTHYVSDKSGEGEFLKPSDSRANNYITIKRYDATQSYLERMLTKDEYKDYQALVARQDNEFNEFMTAKASK